MWQTRDGECYCVRLGDKRWRLERVDVTDEGRRVWVAVLYIYTRVRGERGSPPGEGAEWMYDSETVESNPSLFVILSPIPGLRAKLLINNASYSWYCLAVRRGVHCTKPGRKVLVRFFVAIFSPSNNLYLEKNPDLFANWESAFGSYVLVTHSSFYERISLSRLWYDLNY